MMINEEKMLRNMGGRLEYIDIMKGIGIALMLIGHMHYNAIIEKFIYGFHMPLFFLISGYLYHTPENYYKYVKAKARTLLVPYFIVGVFYIIIDWFMNGNNALWSGIIGIFIRITESLPIESALWFLVSLFWVCCFYCFIDKFVKTKWKRIFLIICITVAGCKWTQYFHFLPWGINSAMSALGFFALGKWFRAYGKENILKNFNICKDISIKYFILIVMFIISGLLIMVNDKVNMRVGNFGIVVFSYFSALSYCILLLTLSKWIERKRTNRSILAYIGRYSIIYMCFNHPMLNIAKRILNFIGFMPETVIAIILEFIIAMGFMAIITEIMKRTSMRLVFSL